MDPEIDAGVAAINAAAEGGRSQGLDWASSLTFDTGKEVSASLIDNIVIGLPRANLIIASCTVLQVDEYFREMKLSKHRMNHTSNLPSMLCIRVPISESTTRKSRLQ